MARSRARGLIWAGCLVVATSACAQAPDDRPLSESPAQEAAPKSSSRSATPESETTAPRPGSPGTMQASVIDWLAASLSREDDVDGPINTDRPTFTPANTVVPPGRLQFESGFTYNAQRSGRSATSAYDLPELAVRYGLMDRVEFRTFWLGQTYVESEAQPHGPLNRRGSGPSDMEVGFKWQLVKGDPDRKWIPTTGLITSIMAPTGGTSFLSAQTVEPYVNLIYGWNLNEKTVLVGSTGYLGMRQQFLNARGQSEFDSFERYHQSLVLFFTPIKRTTLFYEWYILTFTDARDNRPGNFMDGGVLYQLSTNMQLDLRVGMGLSGRPDDFFTGAGFSVRF